MAPQFQQPNIQRAKTPAEALVEGVGPAIQTLPQLYMQYKLARKQQDMQHLEMDAKRRELEARYGTGAQPPPLQAGTLTAAPPPEAGPEEQLMGFEATMPEQAPETPEDQLRRMGTEGFNAMTARGKADRETKAGGADKTFQNEKDLRGQYLGQVKDFRTIRDSYRRIQASAKDPSGAGDLALIFNFMKVLDPGSTVREGEFANAQNSTGIDERTKALYNRIINGERLSDDQRADFVSRAEGLYKGGEEGYLQDVKEFRRVAKESGLDPDMVIIDLILDSSKDVPAAAPSSPGAPPAEWNDSKEQRYQELLRKRGGK